MIGKTFTHYEILSELGSGGMGVVYKARDTKLDRFVALKFLPAQLGANEEDKVRFQREAQSASALDHPNICTIFEIGETDDGQMFIAMAFYDGKPLNVLVEEGEIEIGTAFGYARQVADGLSQAHEAGIVHRDIKPGNVIITDRGVAKIVDFGLAKSEGQSVITQQNSALGTVAYMSPEQSRGETVDQRADIWALGMLLYEMIAGERPFRGTYDQAIIYSILNEDPTPLSEKRPDITPAQARIVEQCLAKNVEERYQTADEFLADVDSLSGVHTIPQAPTSGKKTLVYAGIGLVVVAVIVILVMQAGGTTRLAPTSGGTRPLTGQEGLEAQPVESPDGSQIAFMADIDGNFDLWLHDIDTQQNVNLTGDYEGYDGYPTWSPDSESIAFFSDREGGGIFVLQVASGTVTQISTAFPDLHMETSLKWSPDGRLIAVALTTNIVTIPADGGPQQMLNPPEGQTWIELSDISWYSDSERLMITTEEGSGRTTSTIWGVSLDGSYHVSLTDGASHNRNPVITAGEDGFFFISDRAGTPDLWYQALAPSGESVGEPSALTVGAGIGSISLAPDGKRIYYSTLSEQMNVWAIPIMDGPISFADAQPITDGSFFIELLDLSPDGSVLAFDSFRSGNADVWKMNVDGSNLERVTSHEAHDWSPNLAPDGRIFFHSLRTGNREIWMIRPDGGELVQLTDHPAEEYTPAISPDGSQIVFSTSRSADQADVWIMNVDGSEPRQITDLAQIWWWPIWSPDGSEITFASNISGRFELYTVSALGGPLNQVTNMGWSRAWPIEWTDDGETIYMCAISGLSSGVVEVWRVSTIDGSAELISDLSTAPFELYNAATDGETLYGIFLDRKGDLWELELNTD